MPTRLVLDDIRRELAGEGSRETEADGQTRSELADLLQEISVRHGLQLSHMERDEVLSILEREQKPFGLLQHLVDDTSITDIIVSSWDKVDIQQGRSNYSTDVVFPGQEAYEAFVERLLAKAGATYSTRKPMADGMIDSEARVHAVHQVLCENGPYLTIRLNRFSSVGLDSLIQLGMAPRQVLDYLAALVRGGRTLLISGEVGTGKTTLARALAACVSTDESILVIEDTPEIRLEHPHVRSITTREANSDGAGRITPSECIRAGMRMAMNRIIFGEIRDAEAAESFIDVCASGHPGLSTIHARSGMEAVARLQLFLGRAQRGVDPRILNEQIATAVQAIAHTSLCPVTGKRRIVEVREIGPVADGVLRHREIFRYQPDGVLPQWHVMNRVSSHQPALESNREKVRLCELPSPLDLDLDILYREAVAR